MLTFVTLAALLTMEPEGNCTANSTAPERALTPTPEPQLDYDPEYPGTSLPRLRAIHERVKTLTPADLSQEWETVRRKLLWAGGLKDLNGARPGEGYTGHAFNDYNHCDLTPMIGDVQDEANANGAVREISRRNLLGPGIRVASLPELGPGGSWSTCTNGAGQDPPNDVAHVQFRSRIAFKLVWSPVADYSTFVLVDDYGALLAKGAPKGRLPDYQQRKMNYQVVRGSKYAVEADKLEKVIAAAPAAAAEV
mmetsp:Transcript_12946/g.31175  ORF Transcript_12946/g.31175 Transcript_12946/m.31175 type:complete len:251 (-) Transcript_12946:76-828(-)